MEITIKIDDFYKIERDGKEPINVSPYARWFDETSSAWSNDAESNKFYLLRQQDYANEKLKMQGYLFLNDVFDMIGIPRTKVGQVVGWIYNPDNPNGDNYVDFGLFSKHNSDFVNTYEKSVLLDFNVDGCILDKFE